MKVEVYFNLHKKCLSVRALEGDRKGRVIAHTDAVELFDVTFAVQPAGRAKVLREGRKNVHAFVRGIWVAPMGAEAWQTTPVTYNPYKYESFVNREDETPVTKAIWAKVAGRQITAILQ